MMVEAMAGIHKARVKTSCLRYEDWCVAVSSPDGDDLSWLSAFLDCGFQEAPGTSPAGHVELIIDAVAYDRLLQMGRSRRGPTVEGFANDSAPAWFERWPSNGPARVFHDDRHPIFYVVSDDGARVEILARERTPKCRTALMRVVRELAMDRIVSTGGILVHGSAVGAEGGVVVMCGPKRSGKTTLLVSLLQTTGVSYVSNDRCVLRVEGAGAAVQGLPTLVSIRCDTLDYFPAARQRLGSVRPDLARVGTALASIPAAGSQERSRFSLSALQFCQLMGGCPRTSGGPLRALIFPRITDHPARMTLRRLDPAEARERFHQGLFRASYSSPLGEVFVSALDAVRRVGLRDSALLTARWIAKTIPCFDCRLGGGAAPEPQECRDLLAIVSHP